MNARSAGIGIGDGGEFIGNTPARRTRRDVAIFLGCSYTAARENRIFMLTRTRPWDSPKLVRVAVGYLWTAVNKAL